MEREVFLVVDKNVLFRGDLIALLKNASGSGIKVVVPRAVFEQIERSALKYQAKKDRDDRNGQISLAVYPVLLEMTKLQWLVNGSSGSGLVHKIADKPVYQRVGRTDFGDVRIMATIFKLREHHPGARVILFTLDQGLQKLACSRRIPVICALREEDGVLKAKKVFWRWTRERGQKRAEAIKESFPINKI